MFNFTKEELLSAKGGIITITGLLDDKYLTYTCSLCSKKGHIFPEDFKTLYSNVVYKRNFPCGCGRYTYTEDQMKLLAQDACTLQGLLFNGWYGKFKRYKTKVIIQCPIHGEWNTTTLNGLIAKGDNPVGCKVCKKEKDNTYKRKLLVKRDKGAIENLPTMAGVSILGLTDDGRQYKYTCQTCSEDNYVLGGVCDGVFTNVKKSLLKGNKNCRCSSHYKWTREQREFFIIGLLSKENKGITFVSWGEDVYKGSFDSVVFRCNKHGEYKQRFWDFRSGCRCMLCSKSGFKRNKPASIYLVKWVGEDQCYLKIGITNMTVQYRVSKQKQKTKLVPYILQIYTLPLGTLCENVETIIKREFKTGIDRNILPDGWTETVVFSEDILYRIKTRVEQLLDENINENKLR